MNIAVSRRRDGLNQSSLATRNSWVSSRAGLRMSGEQQRGDMGYENMISEQTLGKITKRLVARFRPERIILFGSHARGKSDDRSDVDILVVCPIKGKRRTSMVEMDGALEGLELAIDIIVLTPDEFELDRQIPGTVARPAWLEGRVIYERSSAT